MFLAPEDIERHCLRQGDVIRGVHLLGALNINTISYACIANKPGEYTSWGYPNAPVFGDVIVVSHSCEIALENKTKLTSIILAPLRDLNKATSPEKIQELIDSNIIDPENPESSFLKYFYLPPHDELQYEQGAVADFSKIFSVRKQGYNTLLEKKVAQLQEDTVSSMALKLALYFHRKGLLAA
jgi:hypothetical protein